MAMETLLTAIAIIKQSRVYGDDRCQALVTSLKDCLISIQGNEGYECVYSHTTFWFYSNRNQNSELICSVISLYLKKISFSFAGNAAIPEKETGTEVGTETTSATESETESMSATESETESATETTSETESDIENVTEMTFTTGRAQQSLEDTENIPGRETETRSAHEKDTEITEIDTANLVRSSLI